MKTAGIFFLGLVAGLIIMIILCVTHHMPVDCGCEPASTTNGPLNERHGLQIDVSKFTAMRDSFRNKLDMQNDSMGIKEPPVGSWGGRVGKEALKLLINHLPKDSQFVYFSYGLSGGPEPKTCVIFQAEGTPDKSSSSLFFPKVYAGVSNMMYISTGTGSTAGGSYCPPRCPSGGQ